LRKGGAGRARGGRRRGRRDGARARAGRVVEEQHDGDSGGCCVHLRRGRRCADVLHGGGEGRAS
jgi:hypothetical protein